MRFLRFIAIVHMHLSSTENPTMFFFQRHAQHKTFTLAADTHTRVHARTKLMHEFFRMGREERAKNLAEAERQRHRADTKEKQFRQRLEDRFIEQTAAKVKA